MSVSKVDRKTHSGTYNFIVNIQAQSFLLVIITCVCAHAHANTCAHISISFGFPLKVKPEARIWEQVHLFQRCSQEAEVRVKKIKQRGERPIKGSLIESNCCKQLGFTPTGDSLRSCGINFRASHQRTGRLEQLLNNSPPTWGACRPGSVSSPTLRGCK